MTRTRSIRGVGEANIYEYARPARTHDTARTIKVIIILWLDLARAHHAIGGKEIRVEVRGTAMHAHTLTTILLQP